MKTKVIGMAIIVTLLVVSLILPVQAGPPGQGPPPRPPGPTDETLVGQLQQETDGKIRISYHAQTDKVRFIGTSPDHPMAQPATLAAGASSEVAARGFLATYGQLFGLSDQAQELTVMRSKTVDRGRSFVRFQQVYQGIPVLGGELIVQLGANSDIISANGEVLPDMKVNVVSTISAETARQRALAMVARNYGLSADNLTTTGPELWIYNPILLGGSGPRLTTLAWRMDVEPREMLPIRELVLVDAHLGTVALHFNQIDAARNRLIYDNQNNPAFGLPGNGPVRTEGQGPTGITDVDDAYDYAGDTYDFYWNTHGRDSLDNAGMNLVSTVRYCPSAASCPYQNAFWNGYQMVYGDGFPAADDVVAHEMTHGVTSYESNLFYYMQSGAINEAFSDIWGEFVDLTNGAGTDTPAVRWLLGEDVPGIGAIRDMQNPPAFNDPDRIGSTYYYCGEVDNGGVHSNGGVGNKAAYLMVDGDAFNGYTVTGIGIDKAAKIFYEVQTNLFTSGSDYQDLYDDLYQACVNLIGTSGITPADCQEVRDATDATEMNQQPTSCPATHAPICPVGQSPNDLFFDDMENTASGNWTSAAIVGSNEWYYPQTANPYGFDATYATSGVYNLWGYDRPATADYYMAMTSDVALPAGSQPYLHFNHAYAFEDFGTTMYDGGVLEYSTNGGSSWNDAGSLFTHNGYDGTISSSWGNPLGGRSAFGGESNGYFSSRLDLSSLAGQNVRFRFRIGTDISIDAYGWFIDDVRIYTCAVGNTAPWFLGSGLPDQSLVSNTSADNAINLWAYADDQESLDSDLTFTIDNTPDPNAGVTLDSNRFIDINPSPGWAGQTDVTIRVTDPGGLHATDTFQVSVTSPPACFYDGFDSGTPLGADWLPHTTAEGQVRVSSSYPYSGTCSVLLDDYASNTTYSEAGIILTISLAGKTEVELDFWWREFTDEDHTNDGVFISDDYGANWHQALPFSGTHGSSWQHSVIDIDTAAIANGLTLNDHFQIKFQFYDDHPITSDGYAIDEVCVCANTPPTISGLPDQTVPMNGSADNAIDLWAYASDAEDSDSDLTFTISNSPNASAGVSVDSNRYIDINPVSGWTGTTDVEVQVADTGSLTDTDSFQMTVEGVIYLPIILKNSP